MMSPLVSVIIPARNAEDTIGYSIASVLEQTMPDLELIVVDDASTDRTASVVSAVRDSRIRLLSSRRNIRYAAARNMALRNARGKWAAFLDADDEWTPWRLEQLLAAARGREDLYVADLESMAVPGPGGRLIRARFPREFEDGGIASLDFDDVLRWRQDVRPMLPVSAFGRNGIEFPEWGSCGEWVFLLSRLSAAGIRGRLVRRVGYLCRAQAAHDSSTLRAREELLSVLEVLAADRSLPETSRRLLSKRMAHVREGLLAAALRRRHIEKLFRYGRRYPGAFLRLPPRAALYVFAKARSFLATAVLSRGTAGAFRD